MILRIVILAFFIHHSAYGQQQQLPIDSVKYYIIEDSLLTDYKMPNKFIDAKNTYFGIVLYEPNINLIQLSENQDTLIELDGFEIYHWAIISIDTLADNSIRIKGSCPEAWNDSYAIFRFENIKTQPTLILLTRKIYDSDGVEVLTYQKVIIEKNNLSHFVCLREPTPFIPGTNLPFIKLDLSALKIACEEDFLLR